MKDKDARYWIKGLQLELEELRERVEELKSPFEIKDCPKCKHPVMAQYRQPNHIAHFNHPDIYDAGDYYQCLTCGSRFTCFSECKLVDKE